MWWGSGRALSGGCWGWGAEAMATKALNHGTKTLGLDPPEEFLEHLQAGTVLQVQEDATAEAGRRLRLSTHPKDNNSRSLATWDGGPSGQGMDQYLTWVLRDANSLYTARNFGFYACVSRAAPSSSTNWSPAFEITSGGTLYVYNNVGDGTIRQSWGVGQNVIGTVYHLRIRVANEGTVEAPVWRVRVKAWTGSRITDEPVDWLSTTYTLGGAPPADGVWGIGHSNRDTIADVWFLGVGTDGDAAPKTLVTNSAPAQPTVAISSVTRTSMVLAGSIFSDPDAGDTFAAVQWQFGTDSTFASTLYDSGAAGEAPNANPPTLSRSDLTPGQTYYGRARYQDSAGNWSTWSDTAVQATTANQAPLAPEITSHVTGAVVTGTVVLDGLLHGDPEGDPLESRWYAVPVAGGAEISLGTPDADPEESVDLATAGLVDGAEYDLYLAAWDGAAETRSPAVRVTYEAAPPPPVSPPYRVQLLEIQETATAGCLLLKFSSYYDPDGHAHRARRVRVVDDLGTVLHDTWSTTQLGDRQVCGHVSGRRYTAQAWDQDETLDISPDPVAWTYDLDGAEDDFTTYPVGSDPTATADWEARSISLQSTPVPAFQVRPSQGNTGGACLEVYTHSPTSADSANVDDGLAACLWIAQGSTRRHWRFPCRVFHKRQPGEVSGARLLGFIFCWQGTNYSDGKGYQLSLSPSALRMDWIGGAIDDGFIKGMGGEAALALGDGEDVHVDLFTTIREYWRNYVDDESGLYITSAPRPFYFLEATATATRDRDGVALGSLTVVFVPGTQIMRESLQRSVPLSGAFGLVHRHHEGHSQFDRLGAWSLTPVTVPRLPTVRILSPVFGEVFDASLPLKMEQPGAYQDASIEFEADLWDGVVWTPYFGPQVLAPDGTGVRTVALDISALAPGRQYKVRVRSRRPAGAWTPYSTSQRWTIDRLGTATFTHLAGYALDAAPGDFRPIFGGDAAQFVVRESLAEVDDRVLVHAANTSNGAGAAWVNGGRQLDGGGHMRGRISTIQGVLGLMLRADGNGGLWSGSGYGVQLSQAGQSVTLFRRWAGVVRAMATGPFAAMVGPTYCFELETVGGQLTPKVWREDDEEPAAPTLPATVDPDPILASGYVAVSAAGGAASSGSRRREVGSIGAYTLDPFPLVQCVPQPEEPDPDPAVFPPEPDWERTVREGRAYLTDVQAGEGGAEQRVRLRRYPRRSLTYTVPLLDARECGVLDALLFGGISRRWLVPLWMDATALLGDVETGGTALRFSTALREFEEGRPALLWSDLHTWEVVVLGPVTAEGTTLQVGTDGAWKAHHTLVIPLRIGRLAPEQRVKRLGAEVADLEVAFTLDLAQGGPTPAAPALSYLGVEVLTVHPDRDGRQEEGWSEGAHVLDNETGKRGVAVHRRPPSISRPVRWYLDGREEISTFRAWLDARMGRLAPLWVPTWQRDLRPAVDLEAAGTQLTVRSIGYTAALFPHAARRHLAFITPAGGIVCRGVTAAVDHGDGTETLTLTAAVGVDVAASDASGAVTISLLCYARLEEDDTEITWETQEFATAAVQLVEIPQEAPAPV